MVKKDSYLEDYMPTDDDNDSLADVSGDHIKIVPYPGPFNFGKWYMSQFPHVIPQGTAELLKQFNITFEADVYQWLN